MAKLLTDIFGSAVKFELTEDKKSGKYVARGEFGMVDEATANGRIYSRQLMERELRELTPRIQDRQVFGELDHPDDGKTRLTRVSHIITDLHIEGDKIIGSAEVVGTTNGLQLKALFEARAKIGVSSRGYGTTYTENGKEIVGDDYKLMTFDFVADPADETANPEIFMEEKMALENLTVEQLKEKNPTLLKQIEESAVDTQVKGKLDALRNEFADQLKTKITELKQEVKEEARGELLSDPDTGLARTTVDKIKDLLRPHVLPEDASEELAAKQAEIDALKAKIAELEAAMGGQKKDMAELESVAQRVGHRLHLENLLRGKPKADDIRVVVKDMDFATVEELEAKVKEIEEQMSKTKAEDDARMAEVNKLKEENEKLQSALEKALQVSRESLLNSYVEKKISESPHAPRLRKMVEGKDFISKEDVDKFVESYQTETPMSEDFTRIRDKMKAKKHEQGGIISEGKANEVKQTPGQINDVLGTPISELRRLSGIA